jgi:DNA-binding transcriptional regulator YiaG
MISEDAQNADRLSLRERLFSPDELAQNLGLSVVTLADWEVAEERAGDRHASPMIWLL